MGKKRSKKQKAFAATLTMAGEVAVLDITGFIGWDNDPLQITDKVAEAKAAGCTKLHVRINSMGGYCYDGLAIGDALRNCGMQTVATVVGTAQSMAGYILQCCDVREANQNATLMIHQPSAGVCGTVDEIRTQAEYLCAQRDAMFEHMAARCGMTGAELSEEHKTMKMYTAQQALERGFIDRISGAEENEQETEQETEQENEPTACGVYEYKRMAMALAMVAEPETEQETEQETEPETEPETEEEKPLTRAEVEAMLAEREARMYAEMGVPRAMLPASVDVVGGGTASGTVKYTMAELDAMPGMQRLEVLAKDPKLAAAYANYI